MSTTGRHTLFPMKKSLSYYLADPWKHVKCSVTGDFKFAIWCLLMFFKRAMGLKLPELLQPSDLSVMALCPVLSVNDRPKRTQYK